MRAIVLALVAFVLIMGSGAAWNFAIISGLHTMQTPITGHRPRPFEIPNSPTTLLNSTTNNNPLPLNRTQWRAEWFSYAENAWAFFKPGVGVSPVMGLVYASPFWHRMTDWDLGGYIDAVLSAEKLGLIAKQGDWGAEQRLGLVLSFLDSRPLDKNNVTFQFYDSDTGTVSPDGLPNEGNVIDEGRLLISLYDAKLAHPELAGEIQLAIDHVNYTYFARIGNFGTGDLYTYYAWMGFHLWGIHTSTDPPSNLLSPPDGAMLIAEPALNAVMENATNSFFNTTSREIYLAQYALFNRTSEIFALSEGQYPPYLNDSTPYVYEAVEVPRGSSYSVFTWQGQNVTSSPEAFTKVAFAFYAIYKSAFGAELVSMLRNLTTSYGYMEGELTQTNQIFGAVSDNTNIMIMEACAYAVETG